LMRTATLATGGTLVVATGGTAGVGADAGSGCVARGVSVSFGRQPAPKSSARIKKPNKHGCRRKNLTIIICIKIKRWLQNHINFYARYDAIRQMSYWLCPDLVAGAA